MRQGAETDAQEADRVALAERLVADGVVRAATLQRIVTLAMRLFRVPSAAVTLVGGDTAYFEASIGLPVEAVARDAAFADHVIAGDGVLVVPDARLDPRFADRALVRSHGVRFYAGAPLRTSGGLRIGAIALFDTVAHPPLPPEDRRLLEILGELGIGEIEGRRARWLNGILQGMARSVGAALVCTDEPGRIVYVNPAAEQLLGYAPNELLGRDIVGLVPERLVATQRQGMARVAAGAASKLSGKVIETIIVRKDGSEVPVDLGLSVWRDDTGVKFSATMRDITERKRREERLSTLAYTDPLTGLSRASRFREQVAAQLEAGGSGVVLLIHVDGLQSINNSLGHAIGDLLIQALAIRLIAAVPHDATLSRWSGQVFAALLPGRDPIRTREFASDIEMALAEPFEIDGHRVVVGATIGAAIAPDHADAGEDLLAAADLALQRANVDHGARFRLFERSMQTERAARRVLRDEVRHALARNELELFYQPQVALATGAIVGAEALMRWRHPRRGLLAPSAFIPAMDDSALALHAGWWSLDQACRQIARWRAEGRGRLRVGVNLFAAQLRYGGLKTVVADLMATHAVAPGELELEVRETIAIQDDEAVIAILKDLRDLGVGIALDDFGTGYASLRTLRQLPVSTIKIDGSFVRGLAADADPRDTAIVAAILGVGRDIGVDVVAEGIETPAQAAALIAMGCPTGQGYLYGRPVAVDTLFANWTPSDVTLRKFPGSTRRRRANFP